MKKAKKVKRRNARGLPARAAAPVVQVVRTARAKLAHRGSALGGGQVAAAMGGAVAGGVVTQTLTKIGIRPAAASLGVAGVGGLGAMLLEGYPQCVATGAACGGIVLAAARLMLPVATAPPAVKPRQAALPPADVQAAFDAARAQLRRSAPAAWEPPPLVFGGGYEA
jgi:hypothetical protein